MSEASWSVAERLAAGARAGTVVTFSPTIPGAALGEDTGTVGVEVDATEIRKLLRGRAVEDPDPRGVWLRGARLDGRLDLDHVDAVCPLVLEHCLLDAGITAVGAHLPALTLVGCRLEHPTQPALAARGLRVDGSVLLTGSMLLAEAEAGAVDLVGARIGGDLDCRATVLGNSVGSAFAADRAQVENNVLFEDGVDAEGAGERGTLRLTGARIGGRLGLRDATLRNRSGPALSGVDLRTFHGVFLEGRFRADGAGERGTIYLMGAHVGGELECRGAILRNPSGPALLADGVCCRSGTASARRAALRIPSASPARRTDELRIPCARGWGSPRGAGPLSRSDSAGAGAAPRLQRRGGSLRAYRLTRWTSLTNASRRIPRSQR